MLTDTLIPPSHHKFFSSTFEAMNNGFSDSEWLIGMQQNQPWAFDRMYNLYVRQVFFMVKGMVADRQAAEDITSEAFIKTFNAVDRYADAQAAKSFLFTVARNAALDVIKINKRHQEHHEKIWYQSQQLAEEDAERKFIASEVIQLVHSEIENLPDPVRQIVRMSIFEERTITEIAQALNISYKTVQNNKTKGLQLLRTKLLKNKLLTAAILLFFHSLNHKPAVA